MLGFRSLEYSLVNRQKGHALEYDELYGDESTETLESLVGKLRQARPVLVYCSAPALEHLRASLKDMTVLEEVVDYGELLETEKVDTDEMHRVFATAREHSMRGLDFRAPRLGMVLVINAAFSSPRDRSQGLSRVGRFTDECLRVKLGSFDDVDQVRSTAVWTRLLKLENEGRKQYERYQLKFKAPPMDNKRKKKE